MNEQQEILLQVNNLKVHFETDDGTLKAVDGVSFTLQKGEVLGLVGESGCGKSVTAQSILGLTPSIGKVSGEINFFGAKPVDMVKLNTRGHEINGIRGKEISMIFQEPMTSFSPFYTIGNQIIETVLLHTDRDPQAARTWTIDLLRKVGIATPEKRVDSYPHEMSGGMRQRAMIAMALACNPSLVIADEPTTSLDVTIQGQVLRLMNKLKTETGASILFITHDLAVVAQMCDTVAVMYLGKIVEYAPVRTIYKAANHPYTLGLYNSIPKLGARAKNPLSPIPGTVPVPINLPKRCGFMDRCPWAEKGVCDSGIPPLEEINPGHFVRCFRAEVVRESIAKGMSNE